MSSVEAQINDLLHERHSLQQRIQTIDSEINLLMNQPIHPPNKPSHNLQQVNPRKGEFMTCDRDCDGVPLVWKRKPWEYYNSVTKQYHYPDGTVRSVPF